MAQTAAKDFFALLAEETSGLVLAALNEEEHDNYVTLTFNPASSERLGRGPGALLLTSGHNRLVNMSREQPASHCPHFCPREVSSAQNVRKPVQTICAAIVTENHGIYGESQKNTLKLLQRQLDLRRKCLEVV